MNYELANHVIQAAAQVKKSSRLTGWGIYWLAWAFAGFGIPEGIALAMNVKNTLSWQFWGLEHLDFAHPLDFAEWTPLHWAIGIFLGMGLAWLLVHLVFGYLR